MNNEKVVKSVGSIMLVFKKLNRDTDGLREQIDHLRKRLDNFDYDTDVDFTKDETKLECKEEQLNYVLELLEIRQRIFLPKEN